MRRLVAPVAAALAAAGVLAVQASAHGDPASEYLVDHQAFFPIYETLPQETQLKLAALVREANARGFPIRIAVVGDKRDLGTEGDAWRKPQTYATALDQDLVYYFKGRVLVVMPNGFGLRYPKHSTAAEQSLLSRIAITPTPTGIAAAATTAIERLAAAQGISVAPPEHVTTPSERNRRDRLVILAAVAAILLAGWLVRRARRWRAATA